MDMFSTAGVILMASVALLSSLGTVLLSKWLSAAPARRASKRASAATPPEKDPPQWESRLAELRADVVSLSSSFEKVTKVVSKQNARHEMRDRRQADQAPEVPPYKAPKQELYRHYGLAGKTAREIAQIAQQRLALEADEHGAPN